MFYTLVAAVPLVSLLIIIVLFKRPAHVGAWGTFFLTAFLALGVWGMEPLYTFAATVRGVFIAMEILFIILGALFLLHILTKSKAMLLIQDVFHTISDDKRVLGIIVGWFFVSFIEGASGFGTPAALAAPLLVALGFRPITAVLVALIGDGVAVSYGAVGLPITLGVADGVAPEQFSHISPETLAYLVGGKVAFFHVLVSSFVPLLMVMIIGKLEYESWSKGLELWAYALFAGVSLTLPMLFAACFLGPEFPALFAALIGGALVIPLTMRLFLLPKTEKPIGPRRHIFPGDVLRVLSPYMSIAVLLLATRLNLLGLKDLIEIFRVSIPQMWGSEISYSLNVLYSPGSIFLVVGTLSLFIFGLRKSDVSEIVQHTLSKLFFPALTLLPMLALVQVLIYSGHTMRNLPSMPIQLATYVAGVGQVYPVIAPFLGVLGAFIAGSATISNLLFSELQAESAFLLGLSPITILALQCMGASFGNMIALHNIVAACATVGAHGSEHTIIRYNIGISLGLAGIVGLLALLLGG